MQLNKEAIVQLESFAEEPFDPDERIKDDY